MDKLTLFSTVTGFLFQYFEEFQKYLEEVHEIESTEAEVIINELIEVQYET